MSLAASVLLLILFGNSQFLDPGTNSDSSMELFPSDNFIDDLPEASSNVNDLPYSGFIAGTSGCPSTSSNDLSNNDLSNNDLSNNDLSNYDLSRVRARNAVCPVLQDGGTPPSTTEDQGKVINQLLAPLDAKDFTGETELKNFVNWFCPDYTPMERAIPVCSSGAEDDIYLNAFGGLTLRNCELGVLICPKEILRD